MDKHDQVSAIRELTIAEIDAVTGGQSVLAGIKAAVDAAASALDGAVAGALQGIAVRLDPLCCQH